MGMDVYGKSPRNERGKYFRNNIWWWHPLAYFSQHAAPEITKACKNWHSNDGDGLDNAASLLLAAALEEAVSEGSPCVGRMERAQTKGVAPGGPFSVENVLEFVAFLKGCGGFEIH